MGDKSFDVLLSKYHTAIAKAQDLQEQLQTKQKQWEKRDADFSTTEKIVRELCEDILAKEPSEMKLGTDYSWSSVPINELINKSKKVFAEYNVNRTDFMRKIMDISEERRMQVEGLQDQIAMMKVSGSRSISEDELEEAISREKETEKEKPVSAPQKEKTIVIKEDESDEFVGIDTALLDGIAEDNASIKITPKAPAISPSRKKIQEKKKRKKEKNIMHMEDLSDTIRQLSDRDWKVMEIIGTTGLSINTEIQQEAMKQTDNDITVNKYRVSFKSLCNLRILYSEKISLPLKVYIIVSRFTEVGQRIYYEHFGKNPELGEMDKIISEHDNCTHGYGIKTLIAALESKGCFSSVKSGDRHYPIKVPNGGDYIPDIIAEMDGGTKMYIEYERATHTQTNFESKCNKMAQVMDVLNFVVPGKDEIDRIKPKIDKWIEHRGVTSLKNKIIRINSAINAKDNDILSNEGWRYVYDLRTGNSEAQLNF